MHGRIIPVLGISDEDRKAWHNLALTAIEPNAFFEPGNLIPAAVNMEAGEDLVLAVVEGGGRMQAALPLRRLMHLGGFRVLTSRPYQVVGLGTPLVGPDAPGQAMSELLTALSGEAHAGLLTLEWLGDDGPVAYALRQAAATLKMPVRNYKTWTRPVLRRERAGGEVLCPKRAKALARWQRGLARELGHAPEVVDRSGDPEWIERFLALEAAGWKGQLARGEGALVDRPGHAAWFRTSALELTRQGLAHLFSLETGDRLLAMFYVLVTPGHGLFAFNMCYDESFRAYAPGVQLLLGTIKYFAEGTEAPFYDSCAAPDNTHFPEFFSGTRRISNVVVGIGNVADRFAVTTAPLTAPVLRKVRRCAERVRPVWAVP